MSATEVEVPTLTRAGLTFRPATLADARLYAELTAVYRPDEPADPGVTERVVGMSNLRFPTVRGNVWTGFTGVTGEYRARGIAQAVKMAVLKQAIEQNVPRVRTDNDEANAAMLHINEELGYQRIPGILSFRKQR